MFRTQNFLRTSSRFSFISAAIISVLFVITSFTVVSPNSIILWIKFCSSFSIAPYCSPKSASVLISSTLMAVLDLSIVKFFEEFLKEN